ncbi:MAG: phosphoglycerate kinase [Planctomycetota bacterium]
MKKSIDQITVRGKRVLIRLDLNVPLDGTGRITDDRRIRAALPTVKKLVEGGGRLVIMSHLGRPDEEPEHKHKYTLAPVAARLGELLGRPVELLPDCVGPAVAAAVARLQDGQACMLENVRFHPAETIKDKKTAEKPTLKQEKESFARQIADLGDVYVNDAFGTCHRDNASMFTVPQRMQGKPRVVGYLVQRELKFLGETVANPKRPFVCVLGGAKVSDKLGVIRSLLTKCDAILVGGAMAYTFLAADGKPVGKSRTEPDLFGTARSLRSEAGDRLRLPMDSVVASRIEPTAATQVCGDTIPSDLMGLDIGPRTVAAYCDVLLSAATIVWNGPMGVFETPPFDAGTMAVARAVAEATGRGAVTIVGGGDSAAAIEKAGLADKMTHVSTGGGASLEFLEGKRFAAIDVLDDLL